MTQKEKIEMLKDTITYLYEKEGRSKSYISRVLNIDRKTLVYAINDWELIKADVRYMKPSTEKYLNKHRKELIDLLDTDMDMTAIAKKLDIDRNQLYRTYITNDKELLHHYRLHQQRRENNTKARIQRLKDESGYDYDVPDLEGEVWKDILGYPGYQVSNMGRARSYSERYKSWHMMTPTKNNLSGRIYLSLKNKEGKIKTLNFGRVVAHTFVDGFSEINNTVDHLNGDPTDNRAENLEWVSQGENNRRKSPRQSKPVRRKPFKSILLDDKYEFKTIKALAKFLGMSETQTRRYLDGESHTNHTFAFQY